MNNKIAVFSKLVLIMSCALAVFTTTVFLFQKTKFIGVENNLTFVSNARSKLIGVQFRVQNSWLNYESALNDLVKSPSNEGVKNKYVKAKTTLNTKLNDVVSVYGLRAKRAVDLFHIWQYNIEKKVSNDNIRKDSFFELGYYKYYKYVTDVLSKDDSDFNDEYMSVVLSLGLSPRQKADDTIVMKIMQIYRDNKALLNKFKVKYKWPIGRGTLTQCMGDYDLDFSDKKSILSALAFNVELTRACPFLAKNTYLTKRETLLNIPYHFVENKERLKLKIAITTAANNIFKDLKNEANKKYGTLTFKEYYEKHVIPRLSKAKERIHLVIPGYKACNPDDLPVVGWRDPEIDAFMTVFVNSCSKSDGKHRFF